VRLALDGQVDRLAGTAPQSELDLAPDRPAQLALGFGQGEIVNRLLVDREDDVAGSDPGKPRGRSVSPLDHLPRTVLDRGPAPKPNPRRGTPPTRSPLPLSASPLSP